MIMHLPTTTQQIQDKNITTLPTQEHMDTETPSEKSIIPLTKDIFAHKRLDF